MDNWESESLGFFKLPSLRLPGAMKWGPRHWCHAGPYLLLVSPFSCPPVITPRPGLGSF